MSLRTKLLCGYLMFVVALVVLGGWSAWRLREMGGVSRRIIANNYDSVVAAQDMKESLERQDSAALFALLGARDKASSQLSEYRARFDADFKKAENNITEVGERESTDAIRRDRELYYQMFDEFLAKVNATESSPSRSPARNEEITERNEYFTSNHSSTNCGRNANACCNSISAPCWRNRKQLLVWPNFGFTVRCCLQVS